MPQRFQETAPEVEIEEIELNLSDDDEEKLYIDSSKETSDDESDASDESVQTVMEKSKSVVEKLSETHSGKSHLTRAR